jgi:iron complex outermembrane receptor protein
MKYWMITLMVAITHSYIHAQSDFWGIVTDSSGQALIGANVYLDNTFRGAITDIKGRYLIKGIPDGKYNVNASYIGFETSSSEIEISGDARLDFQLRETSVMAEEVMIVATRAGGNSPVAHTNVSKEEINERNMGQDIPYLLNLTPSMVTSSDAGTGIGYTSFRIRGTDMNRINVTVNGIPLNDSESHGVWWINMPDFAASVDNLQIQRGVGTSTNGGAAFGATMNIQTFTMNPDPYGEYNAAYGSFNTWKNSLSLGTGMINNKFTLDARLSIIKSDGYIDRAFSDLKSFFISGAWYGERSILKLNVFSGKEQTYQSWWGVPSVRLKNDMEGMMRYEEHWLYTPEQTAHMISSDSRTYNYYTYENETDNYQQDHYQALYSRELGRRLTFNGALHYTYGRGYFEGYRNDENLQDYKISDVISGSDTISTSDLITRKWLDNDFYGFTWSFNYKYKKIEAYLGGGWNKYDGRHYGEVIWARFAGESEINHEWYRNSGKKRDWNTFLKLNYRVSGHLSLFGDLQYRSIEHYIKGTDDDLRDVSQLRVYQFVNPKLGATYEFSSNQRVAASISVGNREPNRTILVDADPARPVPTYETLIDYELSYRLNLFRAIFDANIFYMDYDNQLVLTGEINDVGAAIMNNVKDSYRTGVELVMGLYPIEKLRWDLNLTLSRNIVKNYTDYVDDWDTGEQIVTELGERKLSFSPAAVAGSKLSYEPLKGLKLAVLSKFVGRQYIDNTQDETRLLDPYFVNDFQIQYRLNPGFMEEITFSLMLNNIFNEIYETNAWVYKYRLGGTEYKQDGYFPQAGFNFMAGVILKF